MGDSILSEATGDEYLKAGFLGFQGSGKTFTAVELAVGIIQHFKLDTTIAFFDTEKGSGYVRKKIEKALGRKLLVTKSRSLADLMRWADEVQAKGYVGIVDSITHVWRELCESYLLERQAVQRQKNRRVSAKLEFSDWSTIKSRWSRWPDWYLNSPCHVIVCGRAGYEYDMDKDDEGNKELVKTGIKMKVEGEFGFEPSLLIEMQREFDADKKGRMTDTRETLNRAIVLKDRFDTIDGRSFVDPTFKDFLPHVEQLSPGEHVPVDTASRTSFGLSEQGDDWGRERNRREVNAEKIQAALVRVWPSQGADDKRAKTDALARFWGTSSWKEVSELLPSPRQQAGLDALYKEHEVSRPPAMAVVPPPSERAVAAAQSSAPDAHPPATAPAACRSCGVPVESGTYCPACEVPDLSPSKPKEPTIDDLFKGGGAA